MRLVWWLFIIIFPALPVPAFAVPGDGGMVRVNFVNLTPFEVRNVSLYGSSPDGGRSFTRSSVRVPPGARGAVHAGPAATRAGIFLDMGVMLFTFTDVPLPVNRAERASRAGITLEVSLDANDRPYLTRREAPPERVPPEFLLEAGPIWNNDHAKKRCPEVLREWLRAFPERKARWTGHWWTTVPSEMSVCAMLREDGTAEDTRAAPPGGETRIAGKAALFVGREPDTGRVVLIDELLNADTMAGIRALGAVESPVRRNELFLTVRFGGRTWAAFVAPGDEPGNTARARGNARPGVISMRCWNPDGGMSCLDALRDRGYIPRFLHVETENAAFTAKTPPLPEDSLDGKGDWEQVVAEYRSLWAELENGTPKTVDCILFSERRFPIAEGTRKSEKPGFVLQAANSPTLVLVYYPGGTLLRRVIPAPP